MGKVRPKGKCTPSSRVEHGAGGAAQHTRLCHPSLACSGTLLGAASSPRACTAYVTLSTAATGCSPRCWPHWSSGAEMGLCMETVPGGPQVPLQEPASGRGVTICSRSAGVTPGLAQGSSQSNSGTGAVFWEEHPAPPQHLLLNLKWGKQGFLGLALSKDSGAHMWWAWCACLTGLLGYIQPLGYRGWISSCGATPKNYVARCKSYYYLNDFY